jgi:DNA-binding NarL/FixJ family response regulator
MTDGAHEDLIGVLIVDDHRMFSDSLTRLLEDEPGIRVLGTAMRGSEAVKLADATRPNVILIDFELPDVEGSSLAAELKARDPGVNVVMVTASTDDKTLLAAVNAGCCGFITKDRAAGEVVDAVRAAAVGESLITPAQLARLLPLLTRTRVDAKPEFTERELQILVAIARGGTNKTVARELHLSVNTVRNYVQSLLTKLDVHSKLEAVAVAVRRGVIEIPKDMSA